MHPVRAWLLAARPKTLPLSITPVLVGTALAWAQAAAFHAGAFVAALVAAMLIQVATNLHNDAADFERGADGPNRLGPPRAVAQGWLCATTVRRGAWVCFAAAFLLGVYLVARGGLPILLIGCTALVAGWAYTGGPRPLAYTPFSELFVLSYFGLAAVLGVYWLQALTPPGLGAWRTAAALGLPAAAVLLVNNHRDRNEDARAGRRTLALLLGPAGSVRLYALLLLLPLPLGATGEGLCGGLPWLALPAALLLIRRLAHEPIGDGLNRVLAATAGFQALFGLLLVGSVLC